METVEFLKIGTNEIFKFTIVDLLTIVGIFITGFQLIQPIHRFRMGYGGHSFCMLITLFILSLIASILGIAVVYIPGEPRGRLGYPGFWQKASLVIMLYIGFHVLYICNKPIRKIRNLNKLSDITVNFIGYGNQNIAVVANELNYFIKDLIHQVDKENNDAYILLKILLDTSLIQNITLGQTFTLDTILESFSKRTKVNDRKIDDLQEEFISTIIYESLNNSNSIIARDIRGHLCGGVNQGKGLISRKIFENFEFIHRYDLLSRKWFVGSYKEESKTSSDYAKNYAKFREHATASFFKETIKNLKFYKDLYNGLIGYSGYKGILVSNFENTDLVQKILGNIKFGINENQTEILDYYSKQDIQKIQIDSMIGITSLEPSNFYEAISLGCYHLLESISQIKEVESNDWKIHYLIHQVTLDSKSDDTSSINYIVNENLKELLFSQISENNIKGYYPNMTRNFFHIYGLGIFSKSIDSKDMDFVLKVLQLLEEWLPRLYSGEFWGIEKNENIEQDLQINRREKCEKIVGDLLPSYMFYDLQKHTLTYYFGEKLSKGILDLGQVKSNKIVLLDTAL